MVLRSDEKANAAEIERDQEFRGNVKKGIGTAASLGAAAIGGPLASRIMPFLSEYIPPALAMKGIERVSPRLGAFLRQGQEMGLNVEEGLGFIKDKLGAEKPEPPKQNKNIVEQYSPNLHQYILDLIRNGSSPTEAGAKAKKFLGQKEQSIIKKIEQDHKTDWGSIIESVYGGQGLGQQSKAALQAEAMQPQGSMPNRPPSAEAQAAGQPAGQGQAALMAILQKIQQARSGGQ